MTTSGAYSWAIRLQDFMSEPLRKLAQTYDRTVGRFSKHNESNQRGFKKTAETVGQLQERLSGLTKFRDGLNLKVNFHDFVLANQEIDRLERKIQHLNRPAAAKGRGGGLLSGMMGMLRASPLAGLLAISTIAGGAGKVASMGMDAQREQFQMGVMLHDAQKGQMLSGQLRKYAKDTLFGSQEILKTGSQLISFGESADIVMRRIKMLGNIAAGSKQPISEIALIMGQVKSKRVLQGEELLQFQERRINLLPYLAKVLKKPEALLNKLITERKVTYEHVIKALEMMQGQGGIFEDMANRVANETNSGKWQQIVGSVEEIFTQIGESQSGGIGRFLDIAKRFVDSVGPSFIQAADRIITKVGDVGFKLGGLFEPLQRIDDTFARLTGGSGLVASVLNLVDNSLNQVNGGLDIFKGLLDNVAAGLSPLAKIKEDLKGQFEDGSFAAKAKTYLNPFNYLDGGVQAKAAKSAELAQMVYKANHSPAAQMQSAKVWTDMIGGVSVPFKKGFKSLPVAPPNLSGSGGNGSGLGGSAGLNSTISGAKSQNITINVGKFFEDLHVHAMTMGEGVQEIEQMVEDAMLRIVQSTGRLANT